VGIANQSGVSGVYGVNSSGQGYGVAGRSARAWAVRASPSSATIRRRLGGPVTSAVVSSSNRASMSTASVSRATVRRMNA
jgi:hypothetical protein